MRPSATDHQALVDARVKQQSTAASVCRLELHADFVKLAELVDERTDATVSDSAWRTSSSTALTVRMASQITVFRSRIANVDDHLVTLALIGFSSVVLASSAALMM